MICGDTVCNEFVSSTRKKLKCGKICGLSFTIGELVKGKPCISSRNGKGGGICIQIRGNVCLLTKRENRVRGFLIPLTLFNYINRTYCIYNCLQSGKALAACSEIKQIIDFSRRKCTVIDVEIINIPSKSIGFNRGNMLTDTDKINVFDIREKGSFISLATCILKRLSQDSINIKFGLIFIRNIGNMVPKPISLDANIKSARGSSIKLSHFYPLIYTMHLHNTNISYHYPEKRCITIGVGSGKDSEIRDVSAVIYAIHA